MDTWPWAVAIMALCLAWAIMDVNGPPSDPFERCLYYANGNRQGDPVVVEICLAATSGKEE